MALLWQLLISLVIAVTLFAPGWTLLKLVKADRTLVLSERILGSFVVSSALYISPLILLCWQLQLPLLRLYVYGFSVTSGLCTIGAILFCVLRLPIWFRAILTSSRPVLKTATLPMTCGLVILGVTAVILSVRPSFLDWDGLQYYVRDALIYFRTSAMPVFVPGTWFPPNVSYLFTPPLVPALYAYLFTLQHDLIGRISFESLGLFTWVFLAVFLLAAYLLASLVTGNRKKVALVVLLLSFQPIVISTVWNYPLCVDLPYAVFFCISIYFAMRAVQSKDSTHLYVFTAFSGLACGLSFATKIQGYFTVFCVGLLYWLAFLRRRWGRAVTGGTISLALYAGFWYIAPGLAERVSVLPFSTIMVLFFALFIWTCASTEDELGLRFEGLRSAMLIAGIFLLASLPTLAYLYRGYTLTRSPFGWYRVDMSRQSIPNFEWARTIDPMRLGHGDWRASAGARPGLPENHAFVPFLGYDWNPTLLVFSVIGAWSVLKRRCSSANFSLALVCLGFLCWWLLFGMESTRQLLCISPLITLLQAEGLWTFYEATLKSRLSLQFMWVVSIVLIGANYPFWRPVFNNNVFPLFTPRFVLTNWPESTWWSYYSSSNLLGAAKYIAVVTVLTLTILPFRKTACAIGCWIDERVSLMGVAVLATLILGGAIAWPVKVIFQEWHNVSAYRQALAREVYYGWIPALERVESLDFGSDTTVITFWSYAFIPLTQAGLREFSLTALTNLAYYRDLLTSRNMTYTLQRLREEKMEFAILPSTPRNIRYSNYVNFKYNRVDDMTLLWLIDDADVFPVQYVGDWRVFDLRQGPDSFSGILTVLFDTGRSRGSLLTGSHQQLDGTQLDVVPVIDLSGLGVDCTTTMTFSYRLASQGMAQAVVERLPSHQLTRTVTGEFVAPRFSMDKLITESVSPASLYRVEVYEITGSVYSMDGEPMLTLRTVSFPSAVAFCYDGSAHLWSFCPGSGRLRIVRRSD